MLRVDVYESKEVVRTENGWCTHCTFLPLTGDPLVMNDHEVMEGRITSVDR